MSIRTAPAPAPAPTPTVTPIPTIQGRGAISPYTGKTVTTDGVITAVRKGDRFPGFFLQDPKGDNDPATSDALFVSTFNVDPAVRDTFQIGRKVNVTGQVTEDASVTTVVAAAKGIKPTGRPLTPEQLPAPVSLDPPASKTAAKPYLEAREAMLATVDNALAVGPTSKYNSFTVVNEKVHGPGRDFTTSKTPGKRIMVSGALGTNQQVVTGDRVGGISGPLMFRYDDYEIWQTGNYDNVQRGQYPPRQWGDLNGDDKITDFDLAAIKARMGQPAVGPIDPADVDGNGKIGAADVKLATERAARDTGAPSFRVANLNAMNFFDNVDAPPPVDDDVVSLNQLNSHVARLAGVIAGPLNAPQVLTMEEVENTHVLDLLINRPELKPFGYKYAMLQTNGHRSINPAILYRADQVDVTNVRQAQKQVPFGQSAFSATPPADPQGVRAGTPPVTGPLFSREPLLADVTVHDGDRKAQLTVVANHLISKFSPQGLPTDPLRIQQAKFLNGMVKQLRADHPEREVLVIGDMNDTPDSKAIKAMEGPGKSPALVNLTDKYVPQGEKYTFMYNGQSDLIDHILVTPGLESLLQRAGVRHVDSDLADSATWASGPYAASDHDSPYVTFSYPQSGAAQAAQGATQ